MASEQLAHVANGDDPIELRKAKLDHARAEAIKRVTFAQCTEEYVAAKSNEWSNDKHRTSGGQSLVTRAFPVIGNLPVGAIDLPHILRVLEPIWLTKTETASRIRGRIERVLAWATVRKYRQGDNPARWGGHLAELFPKKTKVVKVEHHEGLTPICPPSWPSYVTTRASSPAPLSSRS